MNSTTLAISLTLATLTTFAAGAVTACSHDSPPAESAAQTTTTSGREASQQPVSQAHADRIATVMCDREQTCSNIGAGHKYATREVCMMDNRASNMNDLTKAHCPNGIDSRAFEACLADIRADHCDNPIDHLERINSCATGSLCPR